MEIHFILVEPVLEENIGASARALKTMGFLNLRIVNPRTDILGDKAKMLAFASHDILIEAKIYDQLPDAIEDLDLVIGTSSKGRKTHVDCLEGIKLLQFLKDKKTYAQRVGIVFGREKSGLNNKELKQCDIITYIPMAQSYPSLNLGQAVMLYAFILSPLKQKEIKQKLSGNKETVRSLKEKIGWILDVIEINHRNIIGQRILERIGFLKSDDIRLFHSFCNAFLKKYSRDHKY
jgi:tRNA/rRNA methyltransferase